MDEETTFQTPFLHSQPIYFFTHTPLPSTHSQIISLFPRPQDEAKASRDRKIQGVVGRLLRLIRRVGVFWGEENFVEF
jgi:hypothetical protein